MTTADGDEITQLDIREKLAHIDLMLAQHDRVRQEIKLAPWSVMGPLLAAAAALFGVGIALGRFVLFHS